MANTRRIGYIGWEIVVHNFISNTHIVNCNRLYWMRNSCSKAYKSGV